MIITLLTDFGTADYFVGAMKGVILSLNPAARNVDISHEIPPYDVMAAAFILAAAYQTFPKGTIHIAVVDPGVGSARRPLVVSAGRQLFVGPDNGLFNYVQAREADARVFHVTATEYFRQPVSATFHGRDVFAPIAAALSNGVHLEQLGVEIDDCVLLRDLTPQQTAPETLKGSIIHVDKFGNCITNFTREHITPPMIEGGAYLRLKSAKITAFRNFFAEGRVTNDVLFAIWGSAGYLEIVAFGLSAAEHVPAEAGDEITLILGQGRPA
ncbi:MAG: hypothetical protein QOJ64_3347 [Acidobacteriota bacterium]|nr:hypothetical protein [Acidobacteriota bacterium]